MGIRTYKKDHLKELAQPLAPVQALARTIELNEDDPLRFWTHHPRNPVLVDLYAFKNGELKRPKVGGLWSGPFSGRPSLIAQLAPALRLLVDYAASKTVTQFIYALRTWWRLFDAVETTAAKAGAHISRVETTADITAIHRQRAFDEGMKSLAFSNFIRLVNIVNNELDRPKLYWSAPERPTPRRHLPPKWEIDQVRFALKRGWFKALDRWQRAEDLLSGQQPKTEEEIQLLKNYERLKSTVDNTGHPRPGQKALRGDLSLAAYRRKGYNMPDMLRGFYPDSTDIRMAFHLCVANTGWNPAVLVSIDANKRFIEIHPKDPNRYLMYGNKERGKSEPITEGLIKSQGSAAVILQTLIRRTDPLRAQLRRDLATLKHDYETLKSQAAARSLLDLKYKGIVRLEEGIRSPWLYVTQATDQIAWLHPRNYFRGVVRDIDNEGGFLDELVDRINRMQPTDRKLSRLTPSDFRDAFASYAYQVSGGMIMYVMKALGHKRPATTQRYVDNTLLNNQTNKLYRTFGTALWHELAIHGRIDHAILAKWSRDGNVTEEERERLKEYRHLRRSRIGVGCKDPTHPPKRIAPNFESDGQAMCPVQRCTLCFEHAVIFPDSLPGLCKRLAELRHIHSEMSTVAFIESSYGEEIENTEFALKHFDEQEVQNLLTHWEHLISNGEHRIIEFEGV